MMQVQEIDALELPELAPQAQLILDVPSRPRAKRLFGDYWKATSPCSRCCCREHGCGNMSL